MSGGTLFSWGKGLHGQLGRGDNADGRVPSLVRALAQVPIVKISGGKIDFFHFPAFSFRHPSRLHVDLQGRITLLQFLSMVTVLHGVDLMKVKQGMEISYRQVLTTKTMRQNVCLLNVQSTVVSQNFIPTEKSGLIRWIL